MTQGMGHRFHVDRLNLLKDPERRRRIPPEPILESAGIKPGDSVIDVGAGTGFWTAPLARLVGPEGRVFAVDVEPIMLAEIRDLVKGQRLEVVEVVASDDHHIPLSDGEADAAVLGFMLHEPPDPPRFLGEIARLLKPGGRILVIDWHKHPTEQGPPLEHRISDAEAEAMLRAAGFEVQSLPAPNSDVYVLLGRGVQPPAEQTL